MEAAVKIARARLAARRLTPYFAMGIFQMVLRESKEVPTMGVSQNWYCYFNPDFVAKCSVDELAGVVIHEYYHLMRRHFKRCKAIGGIPEVWNIAGDFAINDDLKNCNIPLPKDALFPAQMKFPEGKLEEWYYEELMKNAKPQSGGEGEDGDGEGKKQQRPGGSCADGQCKPWEKDEKQMSEVEKELIIRETARQVQRKASDKSCGTIPAGLVRWADDALQPPKVDWRQELSACVRNSAAQVAGQVDYSRSRPSRRQSAYGNISMPAMVKYIPSVACIVDTSGSMGDTELNKCLSEVDGICKAIGCEVTVFGCDTEATEGRKVRAANQARNQMRGGGGTDMGNGLRAAEKLRPNIAVVVTDGYTPWPESNPLSAIVIVCIIGNGPGAPAWARTVRVDA